MRLGRIGAVAVGLAFGLTAPAQPVPGTVLWSYQAAGPILSSPALAADGTVYLGTAAGLFAITNNGVVASNEWTFAAARLRGGGVAIGSSGTLYCGSLDGKLYAINPRGSLAWCYPVPEG